MTTTSHTFIIYVTIFMDMIFNQYTQEHLQSYTDIIKVQYMYSNNVYIITYVYVTGFEKTWLPHT